MLRYTPIIMYMSDTFSRPYAFSPDVVIGIDEEIDLKMRMLGNHASQFYEWLPWVDGELESVPTEDSAKFNWMQQKRKKYDISVAERFRELLRQRYGEETGNAIRFAEAFEMSEYGKKPNREELDAIFPK